MSSKSVKGAVAAMIKEWKKAARITAVTQTPYMVEDNGILYSETVLSVQNPGEEFEAWVKTQETGQTPCWQAVGKIPHGEGEITVDVPELQGDGNLVTFQLKRFDTEKSSSSKKEFYLFLSPKTCYNKGKLENCKRGNG